MRFEDYESVMKEAEAFLQRAIEGDRNNDNYWGRLIQDARDTAQKAGKERYFFAQDICKSIVREIAKENRLSLVDGYLYGNR